LSTSSDLGYPKYNLDLAFGLRYVQIMNMISNGAPDDLKAFQLLSEVADEQPVSQRELAKRLGIALGLVNSYLKNFVAKGFIRIKNYPQNRYAYLLTPNGIAEKARLAYQHVNYFTSLYTVTRQDYLALFRQLEEAGVKEVLFCGVDEVAEVAYLSLQETGLKLAGVMDDTRSGEAFFGVPVCSLADGVTQQVSAPLVVSSLKRRDELLLALDGIGVPGSRIFTAGSIAAEEYKQGSDADRDTE
jgi:DNA-binding MarR family transcriptional regulator